MSSWPLRWLLVMTLAMFARPTHAGPTNAHSTLAAALDLGVGGMRTRPFVVGGVACTSVGIALRHALPARALLARLEVCWTAGADGFGKVPEAARGGNQSLATALAGLELVNARSGRSPFLDAGVGIGHSTLSQARGPTVWPPGAPVSLHDRMAAAYGIGLGVRFSDRPHPWPVQVALRTTGLFDRLASSSCEAVTLTLGFAL